MECCRACRNWYEYDGGESERGECRVKPPVTLTEGGVRQYPRSREADWCGEFKSGKYPGPDMWGLRLPGRAAKP